MILSGVLGYTLEYISPVFTERLHKVTAVQLYLLAGVGKVEQGSSI